LRVAREFPLRATTRRFIVRTTRCAIIAAFSACFLASTCFLAGCGGDEGPVKVDMTTKPAPELKGMLGDQMKNAKIKPNPEVPSSQK